MGQLRSKMIKHGSQKVQKGTKKLKIEKKNVKMIKNDKH